MTAATQDTHVCTVKATSSPLRRLSLLVKEALGDSDLRSRWFPQSTRVNTGAGAPVEVDGYYSSVEPINYKGAVLPVGSYFRCADIKRNLSFCTEPGSHAEVVSSGSRATFVTLHPRTRERIELEFWVGSLRFLPVSNEMAIIAIAASGI